MSKRVVTMMCTSMCRASSDPTQNKDHILSANSSGSDHSVESLCMEPGLVKKQRVENTFDTTGNGYLYPPAHQDDQIQMSATALRQSLENLILFNSGLNDSYSAQLTTNLTDFIQQQTLHQSIFEQVPGRTKESKDGWIASLKSVETAIVNEPVSLESFLKHATPNLQKLNSLQHTSIQSLSNNKYIDPIRDKTRIENNSSNFQNHLLSKLVVILREKRRLEKLVMEQQSDTPLTIKSTRSAFSTRIPKSKSLNRVVSDNSEENKPRNWSPCNENTQNEQYNLRICRIPSPLNMNRLSQC